MCILLLFFWPALINLLMFCWIIFANCFVHPAFGFDIMRLKSKIDPRLWFPNWDFIILFAFYYTEEIEHKNLRNSCFWSKLCPLIIKRQFSAIPLHWFHRFIIWDAEKQWKLAPNFPTADNFGIATIMHNENIINLMKTIKVSIKRSFVVDF